MTSMEILLATSFEKKFYDFVDGDNITKIKDSVFEKYNMTLLSSIKDLKNLNQLQLRYWEMMVLH